VWARNIGRLEDHRAIELIRTADGRALAGVLMIAMHSGEFVFVQAKAVLLATGGGPTMYKYHTPSGDKTSDGFAMALRAGLPLRDMEMVQFHPTGLLAGPHTRMTGTVLEEGLRGAGGYLLNGAQKRFMFDYDPHGERATRDIVSRAVYSEMRAGRTTPSGGVYIDMRHLGADNVRRQFKGMVERCADCGFDLAGGIVEVVPTAHYMMGGLRFAPDCSTELPALFAAGEDTGGVHGANRLGGNGVANSTVFGGIAGDTMGSWVRREGVFRAPDDAAIAASILRHEAPFSQTVGSLEPIREALFDGMWKDVGILRHADGIRAAQRHLVELDSHLAGIGVADGDRGYNLAWHDWLNLSNLMTVSKAIAAAALAREDSRGAHYREDFPESDALPGSTFTVVRQQGDALALTRVPVTFNRVAPGQSLLDEAAA
jgi:fumarate reductase flavoprotein subunit